MCWFIRVPVQYIQLGAHKHTVIIEFSGCFIIILFTMVAPSGISQKSPSGDSVNFNIFRCEHDNLVKPNIPDNFTSYCLLTLILCFLIHWQILYHIYVYNQCNTVLVLEVWGLYIFMIYISSCHTYKSMIFSNPRVKLCNGNQQYLLHSIHDIYIIIVYLHCPVFLLCSIGTKQFITLGRSDGGCDQ